MGLRTMQDNTTTIQIRLDQRDAMQERKQHDRESYKAVLDRLLADEDARDDGNAEAIADAVAERVETVQLEASEHRKIADEVTEQLR